MNIDIDRGKSDYQDAIDAYRSHRAVCEVAREYMESING